TSRWAQALREMSGRLEEIPGEEAIPAYLESYIAAFYERAGYVRLPDGSTGSVTIGGTVSPAGGNFEEPVTQATLKVVGAFHGLSRERSDARKYPAIDPLISWSKYQCVIDPKKSAFCKNILHHGDEIGSMMKVVGEEGTSLSDYIIYLKEEMLDAVYLQQNSFDLTEANCGTARQRYVTDKLVYVLGSEYALKEKEEARSFINRMRQKFIDWNYTEFESDAFKAAEAEIDALYAEGNGTLGQEAAQLLKGGE
ncbi:MAG: V-type ATP synthase subunit A, partial [Clostridia bacterium]|nr:V-type ATP synthase subunit A [Clostridia bacterium]